MDTKIMKGMGNKQQVNLYAFQEYFTAAADLTRADRDQRIMMDQSPFAWPTRVDRDQRIMADQSHLQIVNEHDLIHAMAAYPAGHSTNYNMITDNHPKYYNNPFDLPQIIDFPRIVEEQRRHTLLSIVRTATPSRRVPPYYFLPQFFDFHKIVQEQRRHALLSLAGATTSSRKYTRPNEALGADRPFWQNKEPFSYFAYDIFENLRSSKSAVEVTLNVATLPSNNVVQGPRMGARSETIKFDIDAGGKKPAHVVQSSGKAPREHMSRDVNDVAVEPWMLPEVERYMSSLKIEQADDSKGKTPLGSWNRSKDSNAGPKSKSSNEATMSQYDQASPLHLKIKNHPSALVNLSTAAPSSKSTPSCTPSNCKDTKATVYVAPNTSPSTAQ